MAWFNPVGGVRSFAVWETLDSLWSRFDHPWGGEGGGRDEWQSECMRAGFGPGQVEASDSATDLLVRGMTVMNGVRGSAGGGGGAGCQLEADAPRRD